MEMEQPNSKKWFARRRVVLFTCFALLVGLIGLLWISRPGYLQRQVEAFGGVYTDQNYNFPSHISISNWKRAAYGLFQQAQGKSRRSISIFLYNTDVTDEWVRRNAGELKQRPVHNLNLSRTGITDDGVAQLVGMESLLSLDLAGTSITDQSMSAIRKIPNLQYINLMNTSVTADGISQLSDHPWLQGIEIDGDVLTDETVTHIKAMFRIRELRLKDFNNEQLSCLGGMKNIDTLSLTEATEESLPVILRLSQLRHLSLIDSQLSDDSVETIRKTIPNLNIRQSMSLDTGEELEFYKKLVYQRRVKQIVFLVIALGGGILVLFFGFLWRRRVLHRRRQHVVGRS